MKFIDTPIPEVKLIEPAVFGDERGFFMETWNRRRFLDEGLDLTFVQDNQSRSSQGVLRGIHYQLRNAQGKLVRVVEGAVFDVAVDLRRSSPTLGQWVGYELSAENRRMLWMPAGFGHGFLCLTPQAELIYKCTELYTPEWERAVSWSDPDLDIDWPLGGMVPVVAAKDQKAQPFAEAELYE